MKFKSLFYHLCILLFLLGGCQTENIQEIEGWNLPSNPLLTRWATKVDPRAPHPEYPRPQLQRPKWMNLNGLWDFAITDDEVLAPDSFDQKILVPFPVESALSGIKRPVKPTERIWYQRTVTIPLDWKNSDFLLHFEAVDWQTTVWIDNKEIGTHQGGYAPFSFDISEYVEVGQTYTLTVKVWDPSNSGHINPMGKQHLNPNGIFYTATSGIWQTVWLEPVPQTYVESFRVYPEIDDSLIYLVVKVHNALPGDKIKAIIKERKQDNAITYTFGEIDVPFEVELDAPILWTPKNPHLYDLEISVVRATENIDVVSSYFGMRKISIEKDPDDIPRLMLNNEFVFQNGPLDQGFWPDGIYTPPTEDAMRYDLEVIKSMGFNMLRKHVKVESRRFYHLCDVLGLLVWQDMPNTVGFLNPDDKDDFKMNDAHRKQFRYELEKMIRTKFNHPSIVMWIAFNEGWGQHDSEGITNFIRQIDATRLINTASGWTDRGFGNILDVHTYPNPRPPLFDEERAMVLGEYGGLSLPILGHLWQSKNWGYHEIPNQAAFLNTYEGYQKNIKTFVKEPGISAVVYTQTTDVETETNGLMTYDREKIKIAPELLKAANEGYHAPHLDTKIPIFIDSCYVRLKATTPNATIRYTLNGNQPTKRSKAFVEPILITESTTITTKAFWENGQDSRTCSYTFRKVEALPADSIILTTQGIQASYYEGVWDSLPNFDSLIARRTGLVDAIDLSFAQQDQNYGLVFTGYLEITKKGVYNFYIASDDGSEFFVGGKRLIDNDGLHGNKEVSQAIALDVGYHPFRLSFFQKGGGQSLAAFVESVSSGKLPLNTLIYQGNTKASSNTKTNTKANTNSNLNTKASSKANTDSNSKTNSGTN